MHFANLHRTKPDFGRRKASSNSIPRSTPTLTHQTSRSQGEHQGSPAREKNTYSLTEVLFTSLPHQFSSATQAPFLRAAGTGRISKHDLSRWLSQDRLYAETYITFISSLISRTTLPYEHVQDKSKSLRWKLINLLNAAQQNIFRELEFFDQTAVKFGLNLNEPWSHNSSFEPNKVTEQYMTLFQSFSLDLSQTLLDGMIVLWATEKCYLEAWSYAARRTDLSREQVLDENANAALQQELIPNWTSSEFRSFVEQIAQLTDELAERQDGARKIEVHRALYLHVLDIEKNFWPAVDSEV